MEHGRQLRLGYSAVMRVSYGGPAISALCLIAFYQTSAKLTSQTQDTVLLKRIIL
jgi:hypothetical protein